MPKLLAPVVQGPGMPELLLRSLLEDLQIPGDQVTVVAGSASALALAATAPQHWPQLHLHAATLGGQRLPGGARPGPPLGWQQGGEPKELQGALTRDLCLMWPVLTLLAHRYGLTLLKVLITRINRPWLAARQLELTQHGLQRSFRFWSQQEKQQAVAALEQRLHALGHQTSGTYRFHRHVEHRGFWFDLFVATACEEEVTFWGTKIWTTTQRQVLPVQITTVAGLMGVLPKDAEHVVEGIYGRGWRTPRPLHYAGIQRALGSGSHDAAQIRAVEVQHT